MAHVALKGLAARRLRAALTALAIVLGVALVAGTYVLTDSITGAFSSIYQNIYQGTDATVTGRSAIGTGGANAFSATAPAFSQSLLARVRALPDVRVAAGDVSGSVQLIQHGKAISFGGAPTIGSSVDPAEPRFSALRLVSGRWPGVNQVVVDTSTASRKGLHAGQLIGVQG
ncbi:MAG TPA: ABC transporter permease, partial [Solirubrobacteraceae bacterium]|nr:ABC transporter permease [Solirubrobacteraceae bacterium]